MENQFYLDKSDQGRWLIKKEGSELRLVGGYNKFVVIEAIGKLNTNGHFSKYHKANFNSTETVGVYSICFNNHERSEPYQIDEVLDLREPEERVRENLSTLLTNYSLEGTKRYYSNLQQLSDKESEDMYNRISAPLEVGKEYTLKLVVRDGYTARRLLDVMYGKDTNGKPLELFGCEVVELGFPGKSKNDFINQLDSLVQKLRSGQIEL